MAAHGIFVALALLIVMAPVSTQDPPKTEVLALARPRTPVEAASRLSGTWKLNKELSPRPQTGSSLAAAGQPGDRRNGGAGGRPQAYEAQRLVEERNIRVRALYRELLEAPEALTLSVTLATAAFDADGATRRVNINEKKEKLDLGTALVDSRTRWDGTALTIELDGGAGLKIVETFELSPTGTQMLVTVGAGDERDPNSRGLVGRVHRVYDRVNAGSR
jgi:hypothetical protein